MTPIAVNQCLMVIIGRQNNPVSPSETFFSFFFFFRGGGGEGGGGADQIFQLVFVVFCVFLFAIQKCILINILSELRELAWRSGCVMDCRATPWGSIPAGWERFKKRALSPSQETVNGGAVSE